MHNFFVTFIEVLRDRPPGHDWELEPGVTCGDYLFGMLQVCLQSSDLKRLNHVNLCTSMMISDSGNYILSGYTRCSLF